MARGYQRNQSQEHNERRGGSGILKTIIMFIAAVWIVSFLFGTKIDAALAKAGFEHTTPYGFGVGEYKGDTRK